MFNNWIDQFPVVKAWVDALAAHVDIIEFVISMTGSLLCVYISQVILKESAPYLTLQRISLTVLGIAMFANGVSEYEPWNLVDNVYRPTGVMVYAALWCLLAVMAFRGRVMRQNGHHHDDHS